MRIRGVLRGAVLAVVALGLGVPTASAEVITADIVVSDSDSGSAVGSDAGGAQESCGYTTSPVFAPWGDPMPYTPVQGSSFESGASGWILSSKTKVTSTDSNLLLNGGHTKSVNIPGGASARSPWTCVDATTPSIRFFVKRVSGNGNLKVTATLSGDRVITMVATFAGSGAWAPSPVVLLPGWGLAMADKAQFTFTADPGTVYRIDDVHIDPFRCC